MTSERKAFMPPFVEYVKEEVERLGSREAVAARFKVSKSQINKILNLPYVPPRASVVKMADRAKERRAKLLRLGGYEPEPGDLAWDAEHYPTEKEKPLLALAIEREAVVSYKIEHKFYFAMDTFPPGGEGGVVDMIELYGADFAFKVPNERYEPGAGEGETVFIRVIEKGETPPLDRVLVALVRCGEDERLVCDTLIGYKSVEGRRVLMFKEIGEYSSVIALGEAMARIVPH